MEMEMENTNQTFDELFSLLRPEVHLPETDFPTEGQFEANLPAESQSEPDLNSDTINHDFFAALLSEETGPNPTPITNSTPDVLGEGIDLPVDANGGDGWYNPQPPHLQPQYRLDSLSPFGSAALPLPLFPYLPNGLTPSPQGQPLVLLPGQLPLPDQLPLAGPLPLAGQFPFPGQPHFPGQLPLPTAAPIAESVAESVAELVAAPPATPEQPAIQQSKRGRPPGSKDKSRVNHGEGKKFLRKARLAWNEDQLRQGLPERPIRGPGRPRPGEKKEDEGFNAMVLEWYHELRRGH